MAKKNIRYEKNKMKIIHCINSLDIGGAEKTLVRLINKSHFKHGIVTILNSHKLKSLLRDDVSIISIFPINLPRIIEIFKYIKDFNPDLFQGWMYHGDFLATLFGIFFGKPIFWNIRHGKMSFRFSSKKTIILRSILSILSYFFPSIIVSCSFCGFNVHKNLCYAKNKFKVIHNGINFENNFIIRRYDFSKQRQIRIGSIGRDSPQKNRNYFVKILLELSNFKKIKSFIFGSNVKDSNDLKNYCFLNNINLNLKESNKDISKIFSKIDILIVTSLYGEGCPNVIIEAMQYGVLVFSTDVGDANYIIGDKRFIIPDEDPLGAVSKILKVINSENINQYIIKFRKRSDKLFNETNMINEYEKIWKTIF